LSTPLRRWPHAVSSCVGPLRFALQFRRNGVSSTLDQPATPLRKTLTRVAVASVVSSGAVLVILIGSGQRWFSGSAEGNQTQAVSPDTVDSLRPARLDFQPGATSGFVAPERELARILHQVEPLQSGMSASLCLHSLMAHGLDARFENNRIRSGRDLIRLFTDDRFGRAYFGAPVMIRTRHGLRPVTEQDVAATTEKHYDQTLGCLAQLGLPLTQPIIVDGTTWSLRDVLRDSIACFELRQSEIEWTVLAYATYIPPHREWVNKFGERFSFDELANELLNRDLKNASCCGGHVVEAVLTLLKADRSVADVLSPTVRRRLSDRLREFVQAAITEQAADGSWGPRWFQATSSVRERPWPDNRRVEPRLLATSHIAHWMMYLPDELRVPRDALHRAHRWLYLTLKDVTPEFVQENFCPCSHGALVLRENSRLASPDLIVSPGSLSESSAGSDRGDACLSPDPLKKRREGYVWSAPHFLVHLNWESLQRVQ
jgi:hypothetical protein